MKFKLDHPTDHVFGQIQQFMWEGTGGLGVWFENLTAEIWKIVKKINPCTYIIVHIVFLPFTLLKLARYFSLASLKFPIIRVGQNYCSSPCQAGLGNTASFLEWQHAILMQRPFFFAKIIIPWKCKLGCIFANFLFSFCQKTNLHLYKCSRLSSYLFTFFLTISYQNILSQHVSIFETASYDMARIDLTLFYNAKPLFFHSPQCYHCLFRHVQSGLKKLLHSPTSMATEFN